MRLLVAGRGNQRKYKSRCAHFLGVVRDLPALYAAADIFILPTLYDPFSNASLEALAAGLPVITTRANGLSEVIEDGVHGTVVEDSRDVSALVDAIHTWSNLESRVEATTPDHRACRAVRYLDQRRADAADIISSRQCGFHIGKEPKHLIQSGDLENRPHHFLQTCERKFAAVGLHVLHPLDQNRQP